MKQVRKKAAYQPIARSHHKIGSKKQLALDQEGQLVYGLVDGGHSQAYEDEDLSGSCLVMRRLYVAGRNPLGDRL
jgi:hypothetical protein